MDGVLQQEQLIAVRKECTGNPGSTWPGPARLGMYMCMSMHDVGGPPGYTCPHAHGSAR